MIYVIDPTLCTTSAYSGKMTFEGEWYYYYGNGEYGFTPEKGEEFFTGEYHDIDGKEFPTEPSTPDQEVPTDPTPVDTNRYYFYMPDEWKNEYTETAGIYWWDGTDSCSAWPGYTANKADADGVYYYDVPTDVTFVIWNNNIDGGSDPAQDIYKASAQTINIGTEYYEAGESDNYPEGTDSFDGMIYVIDPTLDSTSPLNTKYTAEGEWYYYYGNGEYGFTPEKGEVFFTGKTHIIEGENPTEPSTPDETNRYYFYMPDEWKNEYTDTAGIYWWEGTDACLAWPGYTANKADADGVYYYDVPTDVTTVIWNNNIDGGSDKTQDIYKASAQTINIGTEYYDPGESDNYPEGTDSFDGMIYVIDPTLDITSPPNSKYTGEGEWYYYYGNGEYGFTPEKGEEFFTGKTHIIEGENPSTSDEIILTDEETLVSVQGVVDADLTVKVVDSDSQIRDIDFILFGEKVGKVYDITLKKDGEETQPDGKVTVKIPASEESCAVYRMESDGTLTDMNAWYEDGFMVFETEHFSLYVVTEALTFVNYGDADLDGEITIKDATLIQKAVALLVTLSNNEKYYADINDDGEINIKDATDIQKYVAGII